MLVSLNIKSWGGKAIDREVTEEVSESHDADLRDSGTYNKQLVSKKALRPVLSKIALTRKTHHMLSLPWDDGSRILSASGYLHYTKCMRDNRLAVEEAAKALSSNFKEHIEEAKTRLGTMFNITDYPSAEDVLKRYAIDVEIKPIPEAGDFRTKLSDATVKAVTKDIEKRTQERVKAAVADVFERIVDVAGKMADKLNGYKEAEGQKGAFRDSLVYNVTSLAELIPSLNITSDERLNELSAQLLKYLGTNSPELLRTDSKLRHKTAQAAEHLAKKARSFLK
jgi:hypothetical protein